MLKPDQLKYDQRGLIPAIIQDHTTGRVLLVAWMNRASLEKHKVGDGMKELIVHRKGATAAFGPGSEYVTAKYREDGQPIIIGKTVG